MHRLGLALLAALAGASLSAQPTSPEVSPPSPHLRNPRRVEGELVVTFSNVAPLSGRALHEANLAAGLSADKPPELHVWSSQIVERFAQRDIEILEVTPATETEFDDPINGNRILHWDLTGRLVSGETITLRRRFRATLWETAFDVDPALVQPSDPDSALHRRFTQSEPLIECEDAEIRRLAAEITSGETNAYLRAERLFRWVCDHLTYIYPPGQRGALPTLARGNGDCGEYSFLFIALCRAAGIPARLVAGFSFTPESTGYHVWAEFHVPPYGWLPADASRADDASGEHDLAGLFAHLPNDRLIASAGVNLPLEPAPAWANPRNSDLSGTGTTGFMQLYTEAGSGFTAQRHTARRLLSTQPLGPR
ncbi:MAG: transglutaminase domain-containing protein [Candidatus Sumerlaeia bacterium]|nr:transglutaminase domain-containing protein [Candidatus Sumerlaeia bacterium]